MKRKKLHVKTTVSVLALMLTLSLGAVPPPPKFPPIEEEIPTTDDGNGISPLTDLDDATTKIQQ